MDLLKIFTESTLPEELKIDAKTGYKIEVFSGRQIIVCPQN